MRTLPGRWAMILSLLISGAGIARGSDPAPSVLSSSRAVARGADVPAAELVLLDPGTQLDQTLPPGWTHLVVKSIPRLESGDLDSLPEMARGTAGLFRTAILAEVKPIGEGPRAHYGLRRIGLALCTPIRGRDTVVSSSTLQTQGVELGMVARTVLERTEQELRRGRIIARTPTFALFSTPCTIQSGTSHREVLLRYALLVDPATGSFRTLVWAIAPDPASRVAVQTMVLIRPGVVFDCALDVAAGRLLGAVPVSWSFAIRALPPGQVQPVSAEIQPWSVRDARTQLEAGQLEDALRRVLAEPPRPTSR